MLVPFTQCAAGDLEWTQKSGFQWNFELRQAGKVFATLDWRSTFGTLATARTTEGAWTFKRVGFWSPRVTIRREGAVDDLAVFKPRGWAGSTGDLRFADGTAFQLEREGFWSSTWFFREPAGDSATPGRVLVRIGDLAGVFRWRGTLSIDSPGDPRVGLLSCVLWYLVVLASQDATAAAIGAASAAGAAAS